MAIIVKKNIERFRLCSIKGMLKLEKAGMKTRGGSVRPIANELLGLKPKSRTSFDELIEGLEMMVEVSE